MSVAEHAVIGASLVNRSRVIGDFRYGWAGVVSAILKNDVAVFARLPGKEIPVHAKPVFTERELSPLTFFGRNRFN
ncbi:MAG: hypothetical protein ACF787_10825, partial [Rhodopirellula sp. JB053]